MYNSIIVGKYINNNKKHIAMGNVSINTFKG